MAPVSSNASSPIWKQYEEIESIITNRYKLFPKQFANWTRHTDIGQALQRLRGAVVIRYQFQDTATIGIWHLKLDSKSNRVLSLSTTEEMINANISEWEEAIPPIPRQQIAHDSWVEGDPGRTAAFRPQPSLEQVLKENYSISYSELKVIANMTPEQGRAIFQRVQTVVQVEIYRLSGTSKKKEIEISTALDRLHQAVLHKYPLQQVLVADKTVSQINTSVIDSVDLYSPGTMLDFKCCIKGSATPEKSVREALNLSTNNPLSKLFGLQPPLWGKATALDTVEKALKII